jgi:inner membrane protein
MGRRLLRRLGKGSRTSESYHPAVDTLTHGIAGAVVTRTLGGRPGRRALLLGALAGMFPDCDFLFMPDRLSYLRNHRGWTHSFVALPFFSLAIALIARFFLRKARLPDLWLFCAAGIASHILLDWITSFGTMFFVPLSRERFALDWVFILDPYLTGAAAISLACGLLWRKHGRAIAAAGTVLLAAYIGFCALQHRRAMGAWRRIDAPTAGARLAVLPQFLSPFRWLGLSDRPGELHAAFFDIGPFAKGVPNPRPPERLTEVLASLSDFYPPPEKAVILRFVKPASSPALDAVRALPDVQIYLAFARFPYASVDPTPGGGSAVTWEDLRFLPWFSGPWQTDRKEGMRREPFLYRVRLDAGGRPLDRTFVVSPRFLGRH